MAGRIQDSWTPDPLENPKGSHIQWSVEEVDSPSKGTRYGAGMAEVAVQKKSKIGGSYSKKEAEYIGKGGGILPSLASSSAIQQIKRPLFTSFPGKQSGKEQPRLLGKMEDMIKASGLFNDNSSAPTSTRARLDVLRVIFALYCESASVYKPILGLIQREYEEAVASFDKVQSRNLALQDDHETATDLHAQKVDEMKRRWKQRLRKANDAVNEWKEICTKLEADDKDMKEKMRKQQESMGAMQARMDEYELENMRVFSDNERLAKECNRLAHDAGRTAQVEQDKRRLEEQVATLQEQLTDMKTQKEVQQVHVNSQVRDYMQQKREAVKQRLRAETLQADMQALTPRPDWSRISEALQPTVELQVVSGARTEELIGAMEKAILNAAAEGGLRRTSSNGSVKRTSSNGSLKRTGSVRSNVSRTAVKKGVTEEVGDLEAGEEEGGHGDTGVS